MTTREFQGKRKRVKAVTPVKKSCAWFALCLNDASTTRPHPVLGAVPICARCNTKMDLIEGKLKEVQ